MCGRFECRGSTANRCFGAREGLASQLAHACHPGVADGETASTAGRQHGLAFYRSRRGLSGALRPPGRIARAQEDLALTSAVALLLGSTINTVPANATDTRFEACICDLGPGEYTTGTITWLNRTATLSGWVNHPAGVDYSTTAIFDAFAGATKIDTETRTLRTPDPSHPFSFTIGDPNLHGGIDRIRVTVCDNETTPPFCGAQENSLR